MKSPKNINYCATVIEIKTLVPLSNCDNIQHAIIMGNSVIVSKEVKIGDIGLFFPIETQLSKEYLSANNLYKNPDLNSDNTKKGYFDENGRIRCIRFRDNKSEGLFMPWQSLIFTGFIKSDWTKVEGLIGTPLNLGDEFDEINDIEICRKYIPKNARTQGTPNSKKDKNSKKYQSKLIDNQFRFHQDTGQLYRNLHRINPDSLIQISYKIHGSSFISSKILCKKPLTWYEKILKKLGVNIVDSKYDYIYTSRKEIKDEKLNPGAQHYYGENIWKIAHDELKDYLTDGLTIYGEFCGYTSSGQMIQKDYDYGCNVGEHKLFIYRITYTNPSGKVFEFSAKQVQDWCKQNGLNAVPELWYGYAGYLFTFQNLNDISDDAWRHEFLAYIKFKYTEKDCYMNSTKQPEEGCVIRIEGLEFEAYKCKSERFYLKETAMLDKGEVDIETEN